jgi:hypothetical protein
VIADCRNNRDGTETKAEKKQRNIDLRKLVILKNKSSFGWSDFGSITEKEQRNIQQIRHSKKTKVT